MLAPVLGAVLNQRVSVRDVIVVGEGDVSALGELVIDYEALLDSEDPGYQWPLLDEREAAAMCYTSGTTGNPKGVVYSHRSTYLHSMAVTSAASLGISGNDKILIIVPQFHANAWGTPYAAWMAGADMIMPRQFLQAEPLARIITEERPTLSAGVPTIWADVLRYSESNRVDFSSLREIICGGSAVPQSLMEGFEQRHHVPILQAWGMTETSPLGAVARPPRGVAPEEVMRYRLRTGRVVPGVQVRVVTPDGSVAPRDGQTIGEFEARGPWVTASYYGLDDPEKFDDGWLRTGDVGRMDAEGYMQITDRTKDVIKSGGEWISSLDLENELLGHRAVLEAAVIAIPDEKWQERPLACIVIRGDRDGDADVAEALARFLVSRVAKWWVPESWTFVKEIPKTTVGKFDKKVLRARHEAGELVIFTVDRAVLG
jgi:fatty-acyl-CoA synthase